MKTNDDIKKLGNDEHKIFLGDALLALNEIEDNSIDLIFADPPYNIGKNFNGKIDKREKLDILSRLVWSYDSSGVQAKNYYGSMYEPILFCVKDKENYTFNKNDILVEAKTGAKRKLIDYRKNPPKVYNSEKVPGNVWEFSRVRYRMDEYENHQTQKPVALLERIIKASSKKGDLILDPFSGSFTTSFVAKKLGRKSIGIELQEDYAKIGLRRLDLQKEYNGH